MPGFKTATKDGVQQTGFVFAKDASSQEVKKIATSADFQVGLSNLPKDLTVTGKATFTQGLSGSLTRLTDDTSYLVAGDNITITSASNGQVTIAGTTRAPVDATYVVFSSNATLTSERIITAGSGITITDGGAGGSLTIAATGGGSGDVVGPASATDNAIARFNLTTGKLIQNSVTTVADTTGNITTLDAEVGSLSGFAGTYAMFGHATQTALGQYAIVQKNDGETWLNSVSDRYIRFTTDGNPSYDGYIGYSALGSSTQIALEGRTGSPTYVTIGRTTGAGSTTIRAGTGGITLTGEVSTSGDITIGGNDIKASDGNTNITLTSNTLTTLAGDLTVSGGKITLTNGSTIDSETLNILKLTESDVRIIGSTLSTDQTTFNLINTTATTLNIGGAATAVNVGASSALAIIGEAELGELPFTKVSFPGAYAFFSHKTLDNTVNGNYALVQSYDGYTYLNSPTTITFQYAGSSISGGTIGTLDNNTVSFTGLTGTATTTTLGNTNTTSVTTLQGGDPASGAGLILTTGATGTGDIQIGNSTETYSINIGLQANNTGGESQTINVGHFSATGGSKNVNIRGDIIKIADTGGYVEICGGYGSTGVTISTAGNIETNGTLTVDSTSILTGNVTFGGNIVADANENKSIFTTVTSNTITIGGASSTLAAAGSLTVGGGYGSAGVSISANGVIEADGNLTVDGTSINIGTTAVIRTVNIGTGAAVQTINLGTSANANIISLGSNAAQSIGINGGAALNLLTNAGTTTIDSGGLSGTGIINIGVFGYAQTISIGNTTVGTSVALRAGSGGITFETAATASSNLTVSGDLAVNGGDITTTSATFNLVNAATTINLGSTTVTRTINIGTNATNVQTINIGTGNAANAIAIGSNAASSVGINGGDALNLFVDAGTITMDSGGSGGTGVINVGTFGYAQTISVGNTTGATSLALRAGTGGITLETATTASSNLTVTGDVAVNGGDITTTSATFNLANAASTLNLGTTSIVREVNIGTGTGAANTNAQTINIGTFSNNSATIRIGNYNSTPASATSIHGDTLNLNAAAPGGTTNICNAAASLGFFGATASTQYTTTGTTTGFTAGTGTAARVDSTYTGNNGTKAYTVGDIVRALKSYGLLDVS